MYVALSHFSLFQSTPLIQGETNIQWIFDRCSDYFNPLPSYKGRQSCFVEFWSHHLFQSTPLIQGETRNVIYNSGSFKFQSTPLIQGETGKVIGLPAVDTISIHSPHTRGDLCSEHHKEADQDFNPLPSYKGRREDLEQSGEIRYFNPLPSYKGRRVTSISLSITIAISIHSPHTRGDVIVSSRQRIPPNFNPLPSYKGRR